MKKILGIVAEYNPMHYGHTYQLNLASGQTGCEYTVIAMSGNFVQRGEPAIVDKWTRAKMAVAAGADLVAEIPAWFALQSAEGFARAGVRLLQCCGVTHMSFGSESGDIDELSQLARWLQKPQTQGDIRSQLQTGITYAAAVQQAAEESQAAAHLGHLLRGANNILAIEYLRALEKTPIIAHTVKRTGQHPNASQIRLLLARGGDSEAFSHIPPCVRDIFIEGLKTTGPIFAEDLAQAIFYALISLGSKGISSLPACSEGLENRLCHALSQAQSLQGLLEAVKTRRYPYTRIQRLLMQALLRFDTVKSPEQVPYLRVLAASPRGKELLPGLAQSKLPLLYSARDMRKLDSGAMALLDLEIYAERVYLMAQRLKGN
ncbi:MAG: nucleotidyltransferase family protein [Eubacteriales bacterium]|nr:nucleotidyltransferase family protein [Eubacteriales bacterium]